MPARRLTGARRLPRLTMMDADNPGEISRRAIRAADRAVLATSLAGDGWPYASLVAVACDHAASPLLLLSDLAEHTGNLKAETRASLLFDATAGHENPLTGPRVTVLGRLEATDDAALLQRYVGHHPDAADYLAFADFNLYRMTVERIHLVAGFGAIHWLPAADVLFDVADYESLAADETDIVAHMNGDHADAVALYAARLLGRDGDGWRLAGVDPEGCDLRRPGAVARLDFDAPVADATAARRALVALAERARGTAPGGSPGTGD